MHVYVLYIYIYDIIYIYYTHTLRLSKTDRCKTEGTIDMYAYENVQNDPQEGSSDNLSLNHVGCYFSDFL